MDVDRQKKNTVNKEEEKEQCTSWYEQIDLNFKLGAGSALQQHIPTTKKAAAALARTQRPDQTRRLAASNRTNTQRNERIEMKSAGPCWGVLLRVVEKQQKKNIQTSSATTTTTRAWTPPPPSLELSALFGIMRTLRSIDRSIESAPAANPRSALFLLGACSLAPSAACTRSGVISLSVSIAS